MKKYRLSNEIAPMRMMVPLLLIMLVLGCRKTPAPPIVKPTVNETEKIIGQTESSFKGNVEYPGKILKVRLLLGRDSLSLERYKASLNDKEFSISVNNLSPATQYYYRYAVGFGMENDFETELKQFTTQEVVVEEELPKVKTKEVTDITMSTAKCSGEVTDEGSGRVSERGVCYSLTANPTVNDSCVSNGTGLGVYLVQLSGLTPITKYHVRAYAKSEIGVSYGDDVQFTTLKEEVSLVPVVTTNVVTEITMTTAKLGGEVLSQGASHVTSRGVCWGITHNPVPSVGNYQPCGSGIGSFSATVTNLAPNTIYYCRAYATNSNGTSYGSEVSFITQSEVVTGSIVSVTQTTAYCEGTVVEGGGAGITERGICWSSGHNPTMDDNYIQRGFGPGTFHVQITDLSPNTTYYIRACCVSGRGISYGNEVEFLTKANLPLVTTNTWPSYWLTSAILKGSVSVDDGSEVTERGICWSTSPDPNLYGSHLSAGEGVGAFEVDIENLQEGTLYYYKAYAKNREGTAFGDECSFTTFSKPVVETSDAVVLSDVSAKLSGVVVSEGSHEVTERGICWSHSQYPNTNGDHAVCGAGEGAFSFVVEGLSPSTYYYCRSYAVSQMGKVYGEQKEFRTCGPPAVQTLRVTNINTDHALVEGNVTDMGGMSTTEYGICWSTQSMPTLSDNHAAGTGNPFSVEITGLEVNTQYFVRAYASNPYGLAYGAELNFHTPPIDMSDGFTVAPGQQVWFSPGNLQYQASTHTWRFAEHQWDYIGDGNANMAQYYGGWIDLFGWGTSGWNNGNVYYHPYDYQKNVASNHGYGYGPTNGSNYQFDLTGQYSHADWGVHNNISGNDQQMWRVLTYSEWDYVINQRQTASGKRFAKAIVNGVNGLILLPDSWNTSYYYLSSANSYGANFNSNVISASQWTVLEDNGAVFLPAAGYRNERSIMSLLAYGGYWSSTSSNNAENAGLLYFSASSATVGYNVRYRGLSVRLVWYGNSSF